MNKHIKKSVSLPKVVYEAVKSISENKGRSFSDVLSTNQSLIENYYYYFVIAKGILHQNLSMF